jgi:hypothetical protein
MQHAHCAACYGVARDEPVSDEVMFANTVQSVAWRR